MGKTVLLYSGGMDSWLISEIVKPDVKLYVNVKSRYAKAELEKLPEDVIVVDLDLSQWEREDAIIPLRNLYFVMVASNYGDEIILGATAGDRVLDKSFRFADMTSNLLSYLYQKQHWTEARDIDVLLPFKYHTKTQLIEEYVKRGGNLDRAWKQSFSCYNPDHDGNECWSCKPCYRKFAAFWLNGYRPALPIINQWFGYATSNYEFLLNELEGRGTEKDEFMHTYNEVDEYLTNIPKEEQ